MRCIQTKHEALAACKSAAEKLKVHDDLAKCREELRNFKEKLERVLKTDAAAGGNIGGNVVAPLTLNFSGRFKRIRNRIHKTNYKKKASK